MRLKISEPLLNIISILSINRTDLKEIEQSVDQHHIGSLLKRIWDILKDWFCGTCRIDAKKALFNFLRAESFEDQKRAFDKLQQLAAIPYKDKFNFSEGKFNLGEISFDAKISRYDLGMIKAMDRSHTPVTNTAKVLHDNGKPILGAIFDTVATQFNYLSEQDLASNLISVGGDAKIVQISKSGESTYVEEMTKLIRSAEETVEISMLTPPEKGTPTYNKLVESFAALAEKAEKNGKIIDIRIVYGRMPSLVDRQLKQTHINEKNYLDELIGNIKNKGEGNPLPFNMQLTGFSNSGVSSSNLLSWNHSKVVVIDRKTCNIGGTNLYEGYNHDSNPIRDISTTFESPRLATQAANFIYGLATSEDQRKFSIIQRITQTQTAMYERKTDTTVLLSSGNSKKKTNNLVTGFIPAKKLGPLTQDELAKADTIVVSRYGVSPSKNVSIEKKNSSDVILPALIRQAQHSLVISQQAISPMTKIAGFTVGHSDFNNEIIASIKDALKSGVQVTLIKSPAGFIAADEGGYDGLSSDDIRKLLDAEDDPNLAILVPSREVDGNIVKSANHAKVIIVDGKAAYVGSHNVYDASHAEYGTLSQNKEFVQKLYNEYIVEGFYGDNNDLNESIIVEES